MFSLGGKVALVTGGNSGLGLGYARGLARAGADVVLWGRNAERNASAVAGLEGFGIRVNALAPGVTRTGLIDNPDPVKAERLAQVAARTPIPRLGEIGDFEGVAVYLASDLSSWHTGDILVIDGGWTANIF